MQEDQTLRQEVMSASTADDVAKIAQSLGYKFSGDDLLRFSGKKVGKVTGLDMVIFSHRALLFLKVSFLGIIS